MTDLIVTTLPLLLMVAAIFTIGGIAYTLGSERGKTLGYANGYSAGLSTGASRSAHAIRLHREEADKIRHLRQIERAEYKTHLEADRETINSLYATMANAYGWLWHSMAADGHAHKARNILLHTINKQQQADGITKARNDGAKPPEGVTFFEPAEAVAQAQEKSA